MSETAEPLDLGPHDRPAPEHRRPRGVSDTTVAAVGKVSEALETTERARGHLYAFHQLTGTADLALGRAVELLREAGQDALADELSTELIGRNVIDGRWSFQILEDYDDGYYRAFHDAERRVRDRLVEGRRHVHEAEMKERRRTHGHPAHRATPGSGAAPMTDPAADPATAPVIDSAG